MFSLKTKEQSKAIGWNGVITFIFSNLVILFSLGISLLWSLIKVLLMAKLSTIEPRSTDFKFILVAGIKLENNKPGSDFILRLKRALVLFNNNPQQLLILGGVTNNNTISEAEVGADFLHAKNVEKKYILIEGCSRHSLENLINARKLIGDSSSLIISNRYHLYRISSLAAGLKLNIYPIAAEQQFKISVKSLLNCLSEAYFVHWYFAGKFWVFISRNKAANAQIS
ncbi:MAG: YdcF family protein [Pseudomonadota bacterium]